MALASETYTGNGSNRDFVVPFPYISRTHVSVSVNGTGVPFTWLSAGQIRTDTAPANGTTVRVQRTTPTTPLTDFADGDGNYEAALDIATLQPLYVVQEVQDFVATAALGGASATAASITFSPAGSISSTNVQAAVLEALSDLRAELAPLAGPVLTGDVVARGSVYLGAGSIFPASAPLQVDSTNAAGQARLRHSTGLGLTLGQGVASGAASIINMDNAPLNLGANGTARVAIAADGSVNLLGGAGALRTAGHISRAELVTGVDYVGGNFAPSAAHGGSRVPDNYDIVLRLNAGANDGGYSPGDEVSVKSGGLSNSSMLFQPWANTSTVGWSVFGPNTLTLATKSGGGAFNPAAGRWGVVFKCQWH